MSIKNNETKLLFNDFEGEGNKKSSSELDFYVKYKDLGLDNEKQYYCYFYEKPDTDKDFVFNKGYVPEIRKNGSGAYDVKYSCKKNCVGLRFFVTDKEITNDEAKDMSPEKNEDVTWYEVKQDEEGKKYIAKYNWNEKKWEKTNISFAYSDDYFSNKKRWKIGPYEKYGDHKFLTHFNNCSRVYIKCDKFKQLISNDINGFEIDVNNTDFNPNLYVCVKLHPGGDFYLDWSGDMEEGLVHDFGTGNNHNGYMEDMYILRFYVTKKRLSINEGNKFDENTLFDKNDKISVFEVRRDKSDNMVLWHLKNKEKNEWEAVDGEVIYYSMHCLLDNFFTEQIIYHCTTQSENDILKSYTVKVNHSGCGGEIISENTVEIESDDKLKSANNIKHNEVHKQHKTNTDKSNSKTKFNHIGKTIFLGLISVGVGFLFGWIYALIPIAMLIVFAILDQKFNFVPEFKTIFCCFRSCLNSNRKIEEKDESPKQDKDASIENTEI